jgi:hypothetical protein
MRVARWAARAALALCLLAAPAPGRAQVAEEGGEASVAYGVAEPMSPEELERWWGAAGAALCGAEMWLLRTNPVLGMNPYALAAGIAGCVLAALDVAT